MQKIERALITGANSGIGFETAKELAKKGIELILPVRSEEKAENTKQRILKDVPNAKIVTNLLDLSSLQSINSFAKWFAEQFPGESLDLLINNAGVMAIPERETTVDGFERQFATNFLGPFSLTALLYPHIKKQNGSRIVIVSSSAANFGKIEFDNLQSEKRYKPMFGAYSQSKLADSVFAVQLQRRLTKVNSPIIATAAHPGYAVTNLQKTGPGGKEPFMMSLLKPLISQDAYGGALPTLYAAVSENAEPGGYYGPDKAFGMKGKPTKVKIPKIAEDEEIGKKLWQEAENLTKIKFDI
ncbi:MAG: oxidoreductase [Defluviitaleaceae bacterium]|nr:oxidoreductase [Defluviitaleaceae bacterium]